MTELENERTKERKLGNWFWLGFLAVVAIIVVWALIDWEWSTIDDASLYIATQTFKDSHGLPGGILNQLIALYEWDSSWGLFRPGYWLYQALFYLFPIPIPQILRLLMVIVVVSGPTLYFARLGLKSNKLAFAVLLISAGSAPLMIGLEFVSLQELSGATLISLGLIVKSRTLRLVLWISAALFKSPFAWIMIGEGIILWRKGERKWATANFLAPLVVLITAWVWAQGGSYTGDYQLDINAVWENIPKLLQAPLSFLLLMTLWWAIFSRTRLRTSDQTLLFGTAFLGYTAQMLPWSVTAYYVGPISYFLALTLVSILGSCNATSRIETMIAIALPIALTLLMVAWPIRQVLQTNTVLRGISTCLENETSAKVGLSGDLVYVTSSVEAPARMVNNLQLRNPSWNGSIQLDNEYSLISNASTTHYIIVGAHERPTERNITDTCDAGIATVYRF